MTDWTLDTLRAIGSWATCGASLITSLNFVLVLLKSNHFQAEHLLQFIFLEELNAPSHQIKLTPHFEELLSSFQVETRLVSGGQVKGKS